MSPADLAQVLSQLPSLTHPKLLVNPGSLDDGGVYKLSDSIALIQTLDFFPPVVDDPSWFGRIAAANALSDIYAMGGVALTAMNIVGWPEKLDKDILAEILKGGQEKIIEAGAALAGGHTVTDNEIKYGLSVTGQVHPSRIWSNANLKVGDVLILTKPLGMGSFSTAMKKGKADNDAIEVACTIMATLNKTAMEIGQKHGVQAATDITGFGLIGHLMNMAKGSQLSINIDVEALPIFEPSLFYAKKGWFSGGAKRGLSHYKGEYSLGSSVNSLKGMLIFDAETSGGLALAIVASKADALLNDLHTAGLESSSLIGTVGERTQDKTWLTIS